MDEIKPAHHVTREECQKMIDAAITQHNRNASMISMFLGIIFFALFADGFFRIVGMIPPFLGIDVSIIREIVQEVLEKIQS